MCSFLSEVTLYPRSLRAFASCSDEASFIGVLPDSTSSLSLIVITSMFCF